MNSEQSNQQSKPQKPLPHHQFLQMATGKFVTEPLYVAAKLNIGDILADGPLPVNEIAKKTETHAPTLYRVLRALTIVGVLVEKPGQAFELTEIGNYLKSGPGSLKSMILWINDPRHGLAWNELLYSVKTGKTGAEKAYGMPAFQYLEKNKDLGKIFNDAMTNMSGMNSGAVAAGYDFSGIKTLMDVGGGHGAMLTSILTKNPAMKGMIYDLPYVIEGTVAALKKTSMDIRCQAIGGDFFASVPTGADAVIMSHIIHDWNDEKSSLILKNCAKALPNNGKILLVEAVVPGANEFSPAKLLDLEMLVMVGGKERTKEEYQDLFKQSGLKLGQIVPLANGQSVIEALK